MPSFYQKLLSIFIVFLTVFYQFTNSQDITIGLLSSSVPADITSTINSVTTSIEISSSITPLSNSSTSSSTVFATTTPIVSNTTTTTSISVDQTTTSTVGATTRFPDVPQGPGWWLLVALLITIAIVIIAGVIFYYRQNSPYRRSTFRSPWNRWYNFSFLQNWRSHSEDTDNIILQLEQPEPTNDQWPPRISFA